MELTVIVENGALDANGDIVNVEGIVIPNNGKVDLNINFNPKDNIGFCQVYKENKVLKAKIDVDKKYLKYYPAIGGKITDVTRTDTGIIINKCELQNVSLCSVQNDDSIDSLENQNKVSL